MADGLQKAGGTADIALATQWTTIIQRPRRHLIAGQVLIPLRRVDAIKFVIATDLTVGVFVANPVAIVLNKTGVSDAMFRDLDVGAEQEGAISVVIAALDIVQVSIANPVRESRQVGASATEQTIFRLAQAFSVVKATLQLVEGTVADTVGQETFHLLGAQPWYNAIGETGGLDKLHITITMVKTAVGC